MDNTKPEELEQIELDCMSVWEDSASFSEPIVECTNLAMLEESVLLTHGVYPEQLKDLEICIGWLWIIYAFEQQLRDDATILVQQGLNYKPTIKVDDCRAYLELGIEVVKRIGSRNTKTGALLGTVAEKLLDLRSREKLSTDFGNLQSTKKVPIGFHNPSTGPT